MPFNDSSFQTVKTIHLVNIFKYIKIKENTEYHSAVCCTTMLAVLSYSPSQNASEHTAPEIKRGEHSKIMLNQCTEWNLSNTKSLIKFLKDKIKEYEHVFWKNVVQHLESNNFKYNICYVYINA